MMTGLHDKVWKVALLINIIWTCVNAGVFYITTEVAMSMRVFVIWFAVIYPIATFGVCMSFTKRYGKMLTLAVPMMIIVTIEYFFMGFDLITPNYLIMSLLVILFGSAIGNVLSDASHKS